MNRKFYSLLSAILLGFYSLVSAQNLNLGNDTVLCGGQSLTLNPFTNILLFEDSLVITYNATLGQTQLVGASKVYMHAGYQETAFGPVISWVGNWGQDDGVGQMQNLGNNFWRKTIHARNYFGLAPNAPIHALAMVFRNADGTQTGKDNTGNDIYLVLNPPSSAFAGVSGFIKRDNVQSISWSTGASTPSISVINSGNYAVAVTDTNGTVVSDSINVTFSNTQLNLGNDVSFCGSSSIALDAGAGFSSYLWSTGATSQIILVASAGTYYVTTTVGNCSASDTIVVSNNLPNVQPISLGADTVVCGNISFVLSAGVSLSPMGDSLKIVYDATQGQTQLIGAQKVYMHSGYQSVPFGPIIGWIGNWGQDDGVGQMTSLGNNLWEITINPNSYYNITGSTALYAIAMVFRNADGTQTGKDNAGNDIYLTVSANPTSAFNGVSATFTASPYTAVLWSTGDTLGEINVNASGIYSVAVSTTSGCVLRDTISISLGNIPFVDAGSSQQICNGENLVLDAGPGFASYTWNTGATTPSITVNTSGTYIINVTNSAGCSGADVINIEVLPEPVAMFTYNVNTTGIVNFTSTSTNAVTFAWDFNGDGNNDASTANPFFGFVAPGTYNVRLIVTNSCGSDTVVIPVNTISSINEYDNSTYLKVYPNPANEFVFIELNDAAASNGYSYEVINMLGATVQTGLMHSDNGTQRIVLDTLPTGIYLIKVSVKETAYLKKINKN
jgi:PKD repeat protein